MRKPAFSLRRLSLSSLALPNHLFYYFTLWNEVFIMVVERKETGGCVISIAIALVVTWQHYTKEYGPILTFLLYLSAETRGSEWVLN